MTGQLSKSKLITILTHILIWSVFALAIFLYRPLFSGGSIPYQFWIRQTVTLWLLVTAFYVNVSVLVPRFLERNQFGYYILTIIVCIAAIVTIHEWVDSALESAQSVDGAELLRPRLPPRLDRGKHLDVLILVISALVLGIGTSVAVIQKWQKDTRRREALEREKVTSELSFLKAQVNPHFFFNTLNNIYVLTAVDAGLAGKAIHQLSRMMRYLLYDTQSAQTMLSQEIAFVKDYISLMRLRFTEEVEIRFDTPSILQDMPVAPMIFLPFVENAFKHGVKATEPSHVHITILQMNKVLDLTVRNSIITDNSVSLDKGSGIGLANTKRRLDLLYPGKYKLDINQLNAGNEYTVHLVIDLS